MTDPGLLTARFDGALAAASVWHRGQRKKGTSIPYMAHLLAVTALVLDDGGSEDEAIAALLHDALEDTVATEAEVRDGFGDRVATLVMACTDDARGDPVPKDPWWGRKVHHIDLLAANHDLGVFRVAAADKLANLRSILDAPPDVFRRFKGGFGGTAWYYLTLGNLLVERLGAGSWLGAQLREQVARMDELDRSERTRLSSAIAEVTARVAGRPMPDGSAAHDPWPWFALDVAFAAAGSPIDDDLIDRCATRWFQRVSES